MAYSQSAARLARRAAVATLAAGLLLGGRAGATRATTRAPSSPEVAAPAAHARCSDPVTSDPTGPATVSSAASPYGRVLVVGSGDYAGCSLYLLTTDELHGMTSGLIPFACSDNGNVLGMPCDTVLWPALLTDGAPIAGPGVNPRLLGTVTRIDLSSDGTSLGTVHQVTYAGQALYRFFLDEQPGETEGANLFDPVTSPPGTWYLVNPTRGLPAGGRAHIQIESVGGGDVLAAVMNNDFSAFPDAPFPVYTLSADRGGERGRDRGDASACLGLCALVWQPVLTSGLPIAGAGVDRHAIGSIRRPDGTRQVTWKGHPLYQYLGDAYIAGITGTQGINGAGRHTPWGVFHSVVMP